MNTLAPIARLAALSVIPLLLAGALVLNAAAPQRVPRVGKAPPNPWVSLFNGMDLSGWVKVGDEHWAVDDGAIHGKGITQNYGYLRTEKKYQHFELAIRFKCEADGNSGVFFRCDFQPGVARLAHGLQFEIARLIGHHTGGVVGDNRGWLVWPTAEHELVLRQDDWNDFQLRVENNRYVSRLNGVLMVDFTDPKPYTYDGYIALQLHSGGEGEMRFKDIFIRDLSKP